MKRLFFVLLVLGLGAGRVQAQTTSLSEIDRFRMSPAAYYNYAEKGDITIQVHVWGAVRNPGLYEVAQGTHMSTLYSLAGGPATTPQRSRENQTITVRLSRSEGANLSVVYEAVMENEILVTTDNPVLRDGDVLTTEVLVKQRFNWRDVVPIVNTVALIALALERISNVN